MGLDFSHTEAHWSYGGFNRARTRLAATIGITLGDMQGFATPWSEVPHADIPWPDKDPIEPLLWHSDCDGELSVEECQSIAPRLRELVENWDDDDHDKIHFLLLADGMDTAAKEEEPLEFC